MERVSSKEEARQALGAARHERKTVALVPTMGALHDGHLSLVRAARERAQYVAVSIFVNPTQFGPGEDFESYPRDLDRDFELLRAEGVDLVFTPQPSEMYTSDAATTVDPGAIGTIWEGASRPGHFGGMATVVTKLFAIIAPDLAFFGEKDYQQLIVVRRLVRDLDLPVTVVGCPTVREADGLALSSRNAYLSAEERNAATVLWRALQAAATAAAAGERDIAELEKRMAALVDAEPLAELDYAAVVDPVTLAPLDNLDGTARAIIASRVGTTRLIDNASIEAGRGA